MEDQINQLLLEYQFRNSNFENEAIYMPDEMQLEQEIKEMYKKIERQE